ncbi:uncharacterized protein [Amphiura filiformis]|uniref:uncharacterized protein n=1 Tax=Amphiura filiformis TaxID=82378 RepID=UPI003B21A6AC
MAEDQPPASRRFPSQCCSRPFVIVALTWGLLTAASLIAVGIHTLIHNTRIFWIAIYLIASGCLVTLMELVSLLACCGICKEEGCCRKVAKPVLWVENWKRGIVYILLGALCFLGLFRTNLGIICGCMLVIAGLLYIGKTCKGRSRRPSSEPQPEDPDRKQLTEDFIEQQKDTGN